MCPAVTSVSLFASAMSFPASIARIVGTMPIMPTTAVSTISAEAIVAASINPSLPETIRTSISASSVFKSPASFSLPMQTSSGLNSRACAASSLTLVPAASAATLISLFLLITSSVCVPIEPVEPSNEIVFIFSSFLRPKQRFCLICPIKSSDI